GIGGAATGAVGTVTDGTGAIGVVDGLYASVGASCAVAPPRGVVGVDVKLGIAGGVVGRAAIIGVEIPRNGWMIAGCAASPITRRTTSAIRSSRFVSPDSFSAHCTSAPLDVR